MAFCRRSCFDLEDSLGPRQQSEFYNEMCCTVVRVQNKVRNRIFREGGGVMIDQRHVLTTSNLVQDGSVDSTFTIHTVDGRRFSASRVPTEEGNLLHLLEIDDENVELDFVEVASEPLKEGSQVILIGHSSNLPFFFTIGKTTKTRRTVSDLLFNSEKMFINLNIDRDRHKEIVQANLFGGSNHDNYLSYVEGCPLFNCMGELVAVYGFRRDDLFDFGLSVGESEVDKLLSHRTDKGMMERLDMESVKRDEQSATSSCSSGLKKAVRPSLEFAYTRDEDEISHCNPMAKYAVLNVAPSVVSLRSLTGGRDLFVCSGTIVESIASDGGGFISYILTSASLLASPFGNPSLPFDIMVIVQLSDGQLYNGEVSPSNVDFHYNIALIKVKSDARLPAADLCILDCSLSITGESSRTSVEFQLRRHQVQDYKISKLFAGDQVVAVARTLEHSVLMYKDGQFSDELYGKLDCEELFVTSCKTDEWFIGGPLVNSDGGVIGINFYHDGYSPFLPSNIAFKCFERLKKNKNVHQPQHGIKPGSLYAADGATLEKFIQKFPDIHEGVIVNEVKRGSQAKRAKIRRGDVVIQCNENHVACSLKFFEIMWDNAGKSVEMVVLRQNGECLKVTMVVEETNEDSYNRWPITERRT